MKLFNLTAKVWLWGGVVGGFMAYPVENPVSRRLSAGNDGIFVNPAARGKSAAAHRSASTFTSISIEASVIRVGPEAPPTTTRGGAV
jgi:hypothetical protein